MARSERWWTLPTPPRPDVNVAGCLWSMEEERGVEMEVVKAFEEEGLTTFPAPPRAVWMYGWVVWG